MMQTACQKSKQPESRDLLVLIKDGVDVSEGMYFFEEARCWSSEWCSAMISYFHYCCLWLREINFERKLRPNNPMMEVIHGAPA